MCFSAFLYFFFCFFGLFQNSKKREKEGMELEGGKGDKREDTMSSIYYMKKEETRRKCGNEGKIQ